ncbi:alanine racemase [Xanthobacteraceae bacterium Astr-EGSB]|uniref:alanine racemase n=1 Tax=Astrobacterium formosum TaxID=3069710 RepID=UPI0027B0DA91|nr:alanine racemase [Xanthobacteraceae bacterium Astr-EGSB]
MSVSESISPDSDAIDAHGSRRSTSGGPADLETGAILSIDLSAITTNWRSLASRVAPAECAAVVKADAYGCGAEPVARALADAGCRVFFVASLAEARKVRAIAPNATVYALNGLPPGSASAFADADVRPVIGSLIELAEWDAYRAASQWRGGCALHFDTGMNRLGLSLDEAPALATRLNSQNHGISLVMSHFVCSEAPADPLNERQIEAFRDVRLLFRGVTSSLANSSGIFIGASAHGDLVRPGYALYGGNPLPGQPNPMKAAIGLKGRIVQIRNVPQGGTVGYGAAWTAPSPAKIAVVSVGYADGYVRAAGGAEGRPGAQVVVAGRHCHVVGRISMDLSTVDITALPEHAVRRGDFATLIGGDITIDDLAAWTGTIGYEVLTNLGARYHRVWTQ